MDGQTTDFRRLDGDGCVDGPWSPVMPATGALYDDRSRLVPSVSEPVRRIESLTPVSVTTPRPGTAVVDFGQNLNGWVRLTSLGPRDTRLVLTHGEVLAGSGLVSTENLRSFVFATGDLLPAGQIDEVISSGRPGETFEPRHTTHGFRYVQIDGLPGTLDPEDIRAVVVHTDLLPTGSFSCSDPALNALHTAGVWSFRGNACEIPTDCPQRERSGFTGDWQVFVGTAALLYDVQAFSDKWLADLAADQWADGRVPTITPNPAGDKPSGVFFEDLSAGSAGWGDAAVLVPWELWRAYGDEGILRRQLPSMQAWVDYAASSAASNRHPARAQLRPIPETWESFLWDSGFHFGEWLEPGVPPAPDPGADQSIVATAFLHRSAALLAASAEVLGDEGLEAKYRAIAEGAREAWQREFLTDQGLLSIETQAHYARGLAFGLFPPAAREAAAGRLAELIEQNDGRLGTGFLSTGQLLPALADHGKAEEAYAVLQSRGAPSWLGMLDNGATTVWEWWDGINQGEVRGSLNHYSKAAVLSFLYTHVAGIRLNDQPTADEAGYRFVTIAPVLGGGLEWAQASLQTPHGLAVVSLAHQRRRLRPRCPDTSRNAGPRRVTGPFSSRGRGRPPDLQRSASPDCQRLRIRRTIGFGVSRPGQYRRDGCPGRSTCSPPRFAMRMVCSTSSVPTSRGDKATFSSRQPARKVHGPTAATPPGELVGLDDPAGQLRTTGLEPLTHDLQAKFVKTAERAQVRAHEGSVRHVAPIGHPRHEQVSSRLPSRLVSRASAPEFGELLGKGSALVVTGSSGGRTQRQIHRIGAEHVLGVAVREDRFDSAAACA